MSKLVYGTNLGSAGGAAHGAWFLNLLSWTRSICSLHIRRHLPSVTGNYICTDQSHFNYIPIMGPCSPLLVTLFEDRCAFVSCIPATWSLAERLKLLRHGHGHWEKWNWGQAAWVSDTQRGQQKIPFGKPDNSVGKFQGLHNDFTINDN